MAQQNNEEKEVIEIDLDEYNEMRKELKELRELRENKEPKEVVKIRLDEYNALLAEKKALEEKMAEVPKFDAVPTNTCMGLSVPYPQPVQKKSGVWETFGKIALGGVITAAGVLVVNALTGGSAGIDNNTFGGNMP